MPTVAAACEGEGDARRRGGVAAAGRWVVGGGRRRAATVDRREGMGEWVAAAGVPPLVGGRTTHPLPWEMESPPAGVCRRRRLTASNVSFVVMKKIKEFSPYRAVDGRFRPTLNRGRSSSTHTTRSPPRGNPVLTAAPWLLREQTSGNAGMDRTGAKRARSWQRRVSASRQHAACLTFAVACYKHRPTAVGLHDNGQGRRPLKTASWQG